MTQFPTPTDAAAREMLRILPLLHHTVSALSLLSHEVKDLRPALQDHQDATVSELCRRLTLSIKRMSPPTASTATDETAVPAGWKLVPKRPTSEMLEAFYKHKAGLTANRAYGVLLYNAPVAPEFNQLSFGWLFHNPDTGTEWSENHPVESGECLDATEIRAATLDNLYNEMISAWNLLAECKVPPVGATASGSGNLGALSAGAARPYSEPKPWPQWSCPVCCGKQFARVQEQKSDKSFGDGPLIRCIECKTTFDTRLPVPTPDLGAQGEPVTDDVAQIIAHNLCGYVDEEDAENFLTGAFTTAQKILAFISPASQTAKPAWVEAYEAECQRARTDFNAQACIAENFPQIITPQPTAQGEPVAWAQMLAALKSVNKLIAEAGITGFNCHDGDWAERLFFSQQATSAAIKAASAAPAAPRTGSGVSVEEIKSILRQNLEVREEHGDAWDDAGGPWIDGHDEAARAILALFAQAPRDGGPSDPA